MFWTYVELLLVLFSLLTTIIHDTFAVLHILLSMPLYHISAEGTLEGLDALKVCVW